MEKKTRRNFKYDKHRQHKPDEEQYPHNTGPNKKTKPTSNHIDKTHKKTSNSSLPVSLPKHRDKNVFQPKTRSKIAIGVPNKLSTGQKCPLGTKGIPPHRKVKQINKKLCKKFDENRHRNMKLFYHKIKKTHNMK